MDVLTWFRDLGLGGAALAVMAFVIIQLIAAKKKNGGNGYGTGMFSRSEQKERERQAAILEKLANDASERQREQKEILRAVTSEQEGTRIFSLATQILSRLDQVMIALGKIQGLIAAHDANARNLARGITEGLIDLEKKNGRMRTAVLERVNDLEFWFSEEAVAA